jgi:hypothetical protein
MLPFKGGRIAASFISLSLLAAVAAQPAAAADFTVSGKFAPEVTFGVNSILLNLKDGSFDGTYSVDGLPFPIVNDVNGYIANPVTLSNWLFNLRNSSGAILNTFSSSSPFDSADSSAEFDKDSLFFRNPTGYMRLEFAPGFTGIGPVNISLAPDQGNSSKTVAAEFARDEFGNFILNEFGNKYYRYPGLDIISGESKSVPTPALLPGLIGMGVAAFRKRRAEVPVAAN